MIKINKTLQLITKLIRLTSEHNIEWQTGDIPRFLTAGTDDIISSYYEATSGGKNFILYKRRYETYSAEFDRLYWNETVVLAIVENNRIVWSNTQYMPAINDLFEYVQEQASGIDDYLDDFLD